MLQTMERERGLGIFVSHLKEAGLAMALGGDGGDGDEGSTPSRGYTIFAPSDRAWAKASTASSFSARKKGAILNSFRFLGKTCGRY